MRSAKNDFLSVSLDWKRVFLSCWSARNSDADLLQSSFRPWNCFFLAACLSSISVMVSLRLSFSAPNELASFTKPIKIGFAFPSNSSILAYTVSSIFSSSTVLLATLRAVSVNSRRALVCFACCFSSKFLYWVSRRLTASVEMMVAMSVAVFLAEEEDCWRDIFCSSDFWAWKAFHWRCWFSF